MFGNIAKLLLWLAYRTWSVVKIIKSNVASWDFLGSKRGTKNIKHRHRRRAKLKVRGWRRRALPYGLVMKCLRRPNNMPPRLVLPEKPVRWRWKQRKVGFAAVTSRIGIESSTLNKFCSGIHDFLALPRLVTSFSNSKFHENNIKSCLSRAAILRGMFDVHHAGCTRDPKTMVLIWDTGASAGLTPFRSDFIDYVEVDLEVRDVTKANKVAGIGTTLHKFVDDKGGVIYLPMVAYHLPNTDVRLFSPQVYHQLHGGHSTVDGENVKMTLHGRRSIITIPIENGSSNLPCVYNSFVNDKVKREYASTMRSGLKVSRLFPALDFFGEMPLTMPARHSDKSEDTCSKSPKQTALNLVLQCVGAVENENLTAPQRELLLWHWKLGIGMQRIQSMMRERHYEDHLGRTESHPPIIKPKYASTSSCRIPLCQSCLLARSRRRSPNVKRSQVNQDSEGAISRNKLEVGDFVSTDQFICSTPGRLPTGYGREGPNNGYNGGTIYNYAALGLIWVENQVSLGASETLMGKERFEQWLYDTAYTTLKHIHGDNGIFASDQYQQECAEKGQTQSFSGVGAQHQNAKAERAIQTVMYMARTFMVHASLHWSDHGVDDISLWPFAVKHAVWLHNRVPNRESGLTPLELVTKQRADHLDLLRTHVWGCPAFVLEPKLQNGQKLPKWNRRSRLGQFLGYSENHSSLVANIRHLQTGYVSPQYHVVYDDLFQTVFSAGQSTSLVDAICEELFTTSCEVYATDEYDAEDNLVYRPPPLDDVWLDDEGRRQNRDELRRQRARNDARVRNRERSAREKTPTPVTPVPMGDGAVISDSEDDSSVESMISESEGDVEGNNKFDNNDNFPPPMQVPEGAPPAAPNINDGPRRSTREKKPIDRFVPGAKNIRDSCPNYVWKSGADGSLERLNLWTFRRSLTKLDKLNRDIFTLTVGKKSIPPMAMKLSRKKQRLNYKQHRRGLRDDADASLSMMAFSDGSDGDGIPTVAELLESPLAKYITLAANDCGYSGTAEELIVSYVHPLFLKAHSSASREDNPSWKQATQGKFADEYWKAMELEIATLEALDAWEVVEYDPSNMPNVIRSTWAFKCKRYPDGLIKKFKARFCARGDMQLEGVDFFETYAPVVQWTTIRLMFILEVILGLKSKQGDVLAAFLHSNLAPGEEVYVEMPLGFNKLSKNGKKQVLRLKKTLYGLRQSPRAFWKYMTEKLKQVGLKQSKFDPCLFIGPDVICVVYVDDLIFWSWDLAHVDRVAVELCKLGVALEQEEDAAGFLGVNFVHDKSTGLIEMKQTGLIKRVIEVLGLDDGYAKGKHTPAESKPLVKDEDGEAASCGFSYASVVGMLLYLSGHTRPDISYAVNCCARYMFAPKHSHELALKRIGRYLKNTSERGMVIQPTRELTVDAYPDADFAGMYGHEKPTDPACAKSRTGFVIMFAGVPILWQSKLQSETALSTMEAEVIALAACMRELISIVDMVNDLAQAVGLQSGEVNMNISVHEDNSGALVLAETLPPQFTPRSKYYATKTIWFREEIHKRGIKLKKIETSEQLGDIFTKGLPRAIFEYLRSKIIGW